MALTEAYYHFGTALTSILIQEAHFHKKTQQPLMIPSTNYTEIHMKRNKHYT